MTDPIDTFFDAWQLEAGDERLERITRSVTPDVIYVDPRTPQPVSGIDALNQYVGMFSANAPGWTARVVASSTIGGATRATVAFGGKGPDGTDQTQLGQYFIEFDGELISKMTGFVGIGEPTDS